MSEVITLRGPAGSGGATETSPRVRDHQTAFVYTRVMARGGGTEPVHMKLKAVLQSFCLWMYSVAGTIQDPS